MAKTIDKSPKKSQQSFKNRKQRDKEQLLHLALVADEHLHEAVRLVACRCGSMEEFKKRVVVDKADPASTRFFLYTIFLDDVRIWQGSFEWSGIVLQGEKDLTAHWVSRWFQYPESTLSLHQRWESEPAKALDGPDDSVITISSDDVDKALFFKATIARGYDENLKKYEGIGFTAEEAIKMVYQMIDEGKSCETTTV